MRVNATQFNAERKQQDRSVRHAERQG
jgi:hypothetical protein